jgi:hypothetical protein
MGCLFGVMRFICNVFLFQFLWLFYYIQYLLFMKEFIFTQNDIIVYLFIGMDLLGEIYFYFSLNDG